MGNTNESTEIATPGGSHDKSLTGQLISACKAGETDRIHSLIKKDGVDINCRDGGKEKQTPLMWACAMGQIDAVKALLSYDDIHLSDRDKTGYTALHWAVISKHAPIVKILCQKKIDTNAVNEDGETCLHKASYYGLKEIARILIDSNANVNALDKLQRTPLDRARKGDMRTFLIGLGAKSGLKGDKKIEIEGKEDDPAHLHPESLSPEDLELHDKQKMKKDVRAWLASISMLNEYGDTFIENGFDRMEAILEMTTEDLKELGVKMGHIRIIGKAITALKSEKMNQEEPGAS